MEGEYRMEWTRLLWRELDGMIKQRISACISSRRQRSENENTPRTTAPPCFPVESITSTILPDVASASAMVVRVKEKKRQSVQPSS
jgi:hypothetical protein